LKVLLLAGSAPTKNNRKLTGGNTWSAEGSRWMMEPWPSIVMSEAIGGRAAGPPFF